MAFGRPCRVIAGREHAEKEDIQNYEFQKMGAYGQKIETVENTVNYPLNGTSAGVEDEWCSCAHLRVRAQSLPIAGPDIRIMAVTLAVTGQTAMH